MAASALRAGAARVEITPPAGAFPVTAADERPFVGVHDPLYVRALILDDGTTRLVIVSVEVTAVPAATEIEQMVAKAANVPAANVLISATHTHSVPLVFFHGGMPTPEQAREIDGIQNAAVSATEQAMQHLALARIAFSRGQAYVNMNNGEVDGLAQGSDATGPSDKSLDVIRVDGRDGKPLAVVVNYASHAEIMFRSVTRDGGYEVTGDLPGRTMQILEQALPDAPVVLYTPAAEADQISLFRSVQVADTLPVADEGAAGWGLLDVQARRLSASVLDTLKGMSAGDATVRLAAATGEVTCEGERHRIDPTGRMISTPAADVVIPLSVLRIGDIALAGVGGDLGSDIGRAIKASSPFKATTVVSMTAGAIGYILPDASYGHPGHGVAGSPLKAGCAERAIVGAITTMLAPSASHSFPSSGVRP